MLFALDHLDHRVHIRDTHSNQEYFCTCCGAPLITKKGEIRQHHFAHKPTHECTDTWHTKNPYDISPWHNDWQDSFPRDNQELLLQLGATRHRADVIIGFTVIEFQNSPLSPQKFDERNNFYFNLGYKVIWLFNLSDLYGDKITCEGSDSGLHFKWKNPKKAFNSYDVNAGCIDLFFQLRDGDHQSIVRVTNVSEHGFEEFDASLWMGKQEFLHYVGMKDGVCALPERDDLENNETYLAFKGKYHIVLNRQQERALQSVEGNVLLLAVPGSGKTTVLVARLGYMVLVKGIPPENILALTYTTKAAEEMKSRFCQMFGADIGEKIEFKTINSLALDIYKERNYPQKRKTIDEKGTKKILRQVYKNTHNKYSTENELIQILSAIEYIKNMQYSDEQIAELDEEIPDIEISTIYDAYSAELKKQHLMDFNDQLRAAVHILETSPQILKSRRDKHRYICVDEAQDTSRIQHKIIQLLADGNNLFMVGDEDQSIYGFRAAYPKAFLNFRNNYINPFIIRMCTNYRSTPHIVNKAQMFISKHTGRYEKNMVSAREGGDEVHLISVKNRAEQYDYLAKIALLAPSSTAFLYRDNDSAVVLIDFFTRNCIPYRHLKPQKNFFKTHTPKLLLSFIRLFINNQNIDAIHSIQSILDKKNYSKEWLLSFINQFRNIASTHDLLELLVGYLTEVMTRNKCYDTNKIEILKILASNEPNISSFIDRMEVLEQKYSEGSHASAESITISTIHSAKGLEFDSVYMVDVYDGRLPSEKPSIFNWAKDSGTNAQEERRIFYVGITRAKNHLHLFHLRDHENKQSFIDELFPEEKEYRVCQEEIVSALNNDRPLIDHLKRKWAICIHCGEIKLHTDFVSFSPKNPEHGKCCMCHEKTPLST